MVVGKLDAAPGHVAMLWCRIVYVRVCVCVCVCGCCAHNKKNVSKNASRLKRRVGGAVSSLRSNATTPSPTRRGKRKTDRNMWYGHQGTQHPTHIHIPADALLLVRGLLHGEDVGVEEQGQLLVGVVDAELLKRVDLGGGGWGGGCVLVGWS